MKKQSRAVPRRRQSSSPDSLHLQSQIVGILKEAEAGVPVPDLLRRHGISKTTFFKWRSKYAGASVSDVRRLRELEGENAKLKRMYAELALEKAAV